MSPEELRSKGDRFALWFILVFLFVHLGIILPAQNRPQPTKMDLKIEAAELLIESQREDVQSQLDHLDDYIEGEEDAQWVGGPMGHGGEVSATASYDRGEFQQAEPDQSKPLAASPPPSYQREDPLPPAPPPNPQKDQALAGSTDVTKPAIPGDLRNQLIELDLKYIDLEKQREKESKSYSLPLIGLSIDEDLIFLLYPAFTLLGLMGILNLRSEYLRAISERAADFPLWVLPVPKSIWKEEHRFWSWVAWNMMGLAGHFVVIYSILQFMFSVNDYNAVPTAINLVFVMITAVYYFRVIALSIRADLIPRV